MLVRPFAVVDLEKSAPDNPSNGCLPEDAHMHTDYYRRSWNDLIVALVDSVVDPAVALVDAVAVVAVADKCLRSDTECSDRHLVEGKISDAKADNRLTEGLGDAYIVAEESGSHCCTCLWSRHSSLQYRPWLGRVRHLKGDGTSDLIVLGPFRLNSRWPS